MDLREVAGTLSRRWYLSVPTLLLAVAAALGVWSGVGPQYTANASVVLIPPQSVVDSNIVSSVAQPVRNPLLYLGGLTNARDVLVASIATDQFAQDMLAKYGAEVDVGAQQASNAPVIQVTVNGKSAPDTMAALADAVGQIPVRADETQESLAVADRDRVSIQSLAVDTKPTSAHKIQVEYAGAAFVMLLGLGAVTIAVFDAARRRRRHETTEPLTATVPTSSAAATPSSVQGPVSARHPRRMRKPSAPPDASIDELQVSAAARRGGPSTAPTRRTGLKAPEASPGVRVP